jgi:hypothetical protein
MGAAEGYLVAERHLGLEAGSLTWKSIAWPAAE